MSNQRIRGLGVSVESGTFKPVLMDSSLLETEGQTYSKQDGRYTKIGNRVFVEFHMIMTSFGTLNTVQAINIGGFPFPIVGDISVLQHGQSVSLALPSVDQVTGRMDSGTQTMRPMILSSTAGHASLTLNRFSSNGDVKFSGHYRTNDV